jgi:prevent-host-death family protein
MLEVTVRELKNHLSEYLRRAQAGEVIIVTSRKKPIARLLPFSRQHQEKSALNEIRKQLAGMPGMRWGEGKPTGGRGIRLHEQGSMASSIVIEDRE